MGRLQTETIDPAPAQQHPMLFLQRLRVACWIIIAAATLTTIEDFAIHRDVFGSLLLIKAVLVATILFLLFASVRIPLLRARPVLIGLLGVTAICLATAVMGVIRHDVTTTRLVLIVVALASATVLPWGLRPQLLTAAIAAASMLGSSYVERGHLESLPGYAWAGVLIAFGIVLYTTYEFARYRATIERYTAELRHSEAHFRSLIENASELVTVIKADGSISYASPAHERVLGFTAAERLGTDPMALVHPDDAPRIRELFARGVATPGLIEPLDYRHRHKDGSWRYMEGVGTNLLYDPAVAGIVVNSRDVSQRKQMEAELRSSEEYLKVLFDYAPVAFYLNDLEGRFVDGNRAAQEMIGYRREELIGQSFLTLDLLPADQINRAAALLLDSMVRPSGPIEIALKRKDASLIEVEVRTFPIQLKGETLVLGVARDITERKRIEAEVQQAKDIAEAANRAKSEFLANMSHEIRTPMNGIIGMTELTLNTTLTAEQREYLGMVRSSADALLIVVNDILDFSKVEAGKLNLEARDFDPRESLGAALKILGLRAAAKGLELVGQIAPDTPVMLVGDAGRLRQVLENLVGNAIKFTTRGEVVVQVGIESQTAETVELHVTVSDTGIGIPADKLERIFLPFEQADGSTTRRYGGTGLGLAISTRLVGLMGGWIWAESTVGAGSAFHFTARCGVSAAAAERRPRSALPLRNRSALVVDDNASARRSLSALLSDWQMQPTDVDGGTAAWNELQRAAALGTPYPIVLLDAHMPELDGFAVAQRIKDTPGLVGATVMLLSSADLPSDTARCRDLGIATYLTKPIQQGELLEALLAGLSDALPLAPRVVPASPPRPASLRPLRILLAEDNAVNQLLAKRLLEKGGHRVAVAGNGSEALALLQYGAFDVVLMDVQMPVMGGFEATAAIRLLEQESGAHAPIIAMTAHAMQGDAARCLAAGMDGYVSKPIRPQTLLDEIARLVPAAREQSAVAA